ncbi:MAG: DUF4412 domain-containing protein [Flavobacteriales bacterium]|nr:DUF4412 domain-containing protein [Flavobacteriales bacterium]
MKKLSLILALLASSILFAQDNFEGLVQFEMKYENLSEEIKPMMSMLPKSTTIEFKDGISRSVTPNAMGGETIILSNSESGETITLINMMGKKYALKSNTNDTKEDNKPEVELIDETKEVLGYKCKKAIVTDKEGNETEIYYSEELNNINFSGNVEEINGFPMQTSISQDMFTMIQTVSSIDKKKTKKIKLEIPSDYTLTTVEELQKMMGGGM